MLGVPDDPFEESFGNYFLKGLVRELRLAKTVRLAHQVASKPVSRPLDADPTAERIFLRFQVRGIAGGFPWPR
jgi:hypothetical protein